MTQFQKFSVAPQGYVQGGSVQYTLDPDLGTIYYEYSIDAKVFFFSKNFSGQGATKVDPITLLSSAIKAGQKLVFGSLAINVQKLVGHLATCAIAVADGSVNEAGSLVLDLGGKYIQLVSISSAGTVAGFEIDLLASKV